MNLFEFIGVILAVTVLVYILFLFFGTRKIIERLEAKNIPIDPGLKRGMDVLGKITLGKISFEPSPKSLKESIYFDSNGKYVITEDEKRILNNLFMDLASEERINSYTNDFSSYDRDYDSIELINELEEMDNYILATVYGGTNSLKEERESTDTLIHQWATQYSIETNELNKKILKKAIAAKLFANDGYVVDALAEFFPNTGLAVVWERTWTAAQVVPIDTSLPKLLSTIEPSIEMNMRKRIQMIENNYFGLNSWVNTPGVSLTNVVSIEAYNAGAYVFDWNDMPWIIRTLLCTALYMKTVIPSSYALDPRDILKTVGIKITDELVASISNIYNEWGTLNDKNSLADIGYVMEQDHLDTFLTCLGDCSATIKEAQYHALAMFKKDVINISPPRINTAKENIDWNLAVRMWNEVFKQDATSFKQFVLDHVYGKTMNLAYVQSVGASLREGVIVADREREDGYDQTSPPLSDPNRVFNDRWCNPLQLVEFDLNNINRGTRRLYAPPFLSDDLAATAAANTANAAVSETAVMRRGYVPMNEIHEFGYMSPYTRWGLNGLMSVSYIGASVGKSRMTKPKYQMIAPRGIKAITGIMSYKECYTSNKFDKFVLHDFWLAPMSVSGLYYTESPDKIFEGALANAPCWSYSKRSEISKLNNTTLTNEMMYFNLPDEHWQYLAASLISHNPLYAYGMMMFPAAGIDYNAMNIVNSSKGVTNPYAMTDYYVSSSAWTAPPTRKNTWSTFYLHVDIWNPSTATTNKISKEYFDIAENDDSSVLKQLLSLNSSTEMTLGTPKYYLTKTNTVAGDVNSSYPLSYESKCIRTTAYNMTTVKPPSAGVNDSTLPTAFNTGDSLWGVNTYTRTMDALTAIKAGINATGRVSNYTSSLYSTVQGEAVKNMTPSEITAMKSYFFTPLTSSINSITGTINFNSPGSLYKTTSSTLSNAGNIVFPKTVSLNNQSVLSTASNNSSFSIYAAGGYFGGIMPTDNYNYNYGTSNSNAAYNNYGDYNMTYMPYVFDIYNIYSTVYDTTYFFDYSAKPIAKISAALGVLSYATPRIRTVDTRFTPISGNDWMVSSTISNAYTKYKPSTNVNYPCGSRLVNTVHAAAELGSVSDHTTIFNYYRGSCRYIPGFTKEIYLPSDENTRRSKGYITAYPMGGIYNLTRDSKVHGNSIYQITMRGFGTLFALLDFEYNTCKDLAGAMQGANYSYYYNFYYGSMTNPYVNSAYVNSGVQRVFNKAPNSTTTVSNYPLLNAIIYDKCIVSIPHSRFYRRSANHQEFIQSNDPYCAYSMNTTISLMYITTPITLGSSNWARNAVSWSGANSSWSDWPKYFCGLAFDNTKSRFGEYGSTSKSIAVWSDGDGDIYNPNFNFAAPRMCYKPYIKFYYNYADSSAITVASPCYSIYSTAVDITPNLTPTTISSTSPPLYFPVEKFPTTNFSVSCNLIQTRSIELASGSFHPLPGTGTVSTSTGSNYIAPTPITNFFYSTVSGDKEFLGRNPIWLYGNIQYTRPKVDTVSKDIALNAKNFNTHPYDHFERSFTLSALNPGSYNLYGTTSDDRYSTLLNTVHNILSATYTGPMTKSEYIINLNNTVASSATATATTPPLVLLPILLPSEEYYKIFNAGSGIDDTVGVHYADSVRVEMVRRLTIKKSVYEKQVDYIDAVKKFKIRNVATAQYVTMGKRIPSVFNPIITEKTIKKAAALAAATAVETMETTIASSVSPYVELGKVKTNPFTMVEDNTKDVLSKKFPMFDTRLDLNDKSTWGIWSNVPKSDDVWDNTLQFHMEDNVDYAAVFSFTPNDKTSYRNTTQDILAGSRYKCYVDNVIYDDDDDDEGSGSNEYIPKSVSGKVLLSAMRWNSHLDVIEMIAVEEVVSVLPTSSTPKSNMLYIYTEESGSIRRKWVNTVDNRVVNIAFVNSELEIIIMVDYKNTIDGSITSVKMNSDGDILLTPTLFLTPSPPNLTYSSIGTLVGAPANTVVKHPVYDTYLLTNGEVVLYDYNQNKFCCLCSTTSSSTNSSSSTTTSTKLHPWFDGSFRNKFTFDSVHVLDEVLDFSSWSASDGTTIYTTVPSTDPSVPSTHVVDSEGKITNIFNPVSNIISFSSLSKDNFCVAFDNQVVHRYGKETFVFNDYNHVDIVKSLTHYLIRNTTTTTTGTYKRLIPGMGMFDWGIVNNIDVETEEIFTKGGTSAITGFTAATTNLVLPYEEGSTDFIRILSGGVVSISRKVDGATTTTTTTVETNPTTTMCYFLKGKYKFSIDQVLRTLLKDRTTANSLTWHPEHSNVLVLKIGTTRTYYSDNFARNWELGLEDLVTRRRLYWRSPDVHSSASKQAMLFKTLYATGILNKFCCVTRTGLGKKATAPTSLLPTYIDSTILGKADPFFTHLVKLSCVLPKLRMFTRVYNEKTLISLPTDMFCVGYANPSLEYGNELSRYQMFKTLNDSEAESLPAIYFYKDLDVDNPTNNTNPLSRTDEMDMNMLIAMSGGSSSTSSTSTTTTTTPSSIPYVSYVSSRADPVFHVDNKDTVFDKTYFSKEFSNYNSITSSKEELDLTSSDLTLRLLPMTKARGQYRFMVWLGDYEKMTHDKPKTVFSSINTGDNGYIPNAWTLSTDNNTNWTYARMLTMMPSTPYIDTVTNSIEFRYLEPVMLSVTNAEVDDMTTFLKTCVNEYITANVITRTGGTVVILPETVIQSSYSRLSSSDISTTSSSSPGVLADAIMTDYETNKQSISVAANKFQEYSWNTETNSYVSASSSSSSSSSMSNSSSTTTENSIKLKAVITKSLDDVKLFAATQKITVASDESAEVKSILESLDKLDTGTGSKSLTNLMYTWMINGKLSNWSLYAPTLDFIQNILVRYTMIGMFTLQLHSPLPYKSVKARSNTDYFGSSTFQGAGIDVGETTSGFLEGAYPITLSIAQYVIGPLLFTYGKVGVVATAPDCTNPMLWGDAEGQSKYGVTLAENFYPGLVLCNWKLLVKLAAYRFWDRVAWTNNEVNLSDLEQLMNYCINVVEESVADDTNTAWYLAERWDRCKEATRSMLSSNSSTYMNILRRGMLANTMLVNSGKRVRTQSTIVTTPVDSTDTELTIKSSNISITETRYSLAQDYVDSYYWYWASTDKNIYRYDPNTKTATFYKVSPNKLMCVSSEGSLFVDYDGVDSRLYDMITNEVKFTVKGSRVHQVVLMKTYFLVATIDNTTSKMRVYALDFKFKEMKFVANGVVIGQNKIIFDGTLYYSSEIPLVTANGESGNVLIVPPPSDKAKTQTTEAFGNWFSFSGSTLYAAPKMLSRNNSNFFWAIIREFTSPIVAIFATANKLHVKLENGSAVIDKVDLTLSYNDTPQLRTNIEKGVNAERQNMNSGYTLRADKMGEQDTACYTFASLTNIQDSILNIFSTNRFFGNDLASICMLLCLTLNQDQWDGLLGCVGSRSVYSMWNMELK